MAMTRCKECGSDVSTKAGACPKCGAKQVRTSGCAWVVLWLLVLSVFAGAVTQFSGNEPSSKAEFVSATSHPVKPSYSVPSTDAKSLINGLSSSRNSEGSIIISGSSLLPPGTKVWIERRNSSGKAYAQSEVYVNQSGHFSSGPFSDKGMAPKEGPRHIGIVSYFNGAWQRDAVLSLVGEKGNKLPTTLLKPDDPEFPQAGGHLDVDRVVQFPPLSPETIAIDHVKSSKLFVQGHGKAVDTVSEIVTYFAKAPGFKPLGWSATKNESKWVITLDCEDGSARKKAQWEYDPKNGKVRYLDSLSKILSWLPAE